jgi:predicted nuclease of predicted toxin-antitoxin system
VKPPEPFTWFIDRSLGRKIAVDLRAAGFRVEEHSDHFVHDAPDADWLAEVGRRGWIVLTKDKAIRRNALEMAAILSGNVACFSLGHGNLKAAQMAQAFIAARSRMHNALHRYQPPMTASVTATGHVRVLMEDGRLLSLPRDIR